MDDELLIVLLELDEALVEQTAACEEILEYLKRARTQRSLSLAMM